MRKTTSKILSSVLAAAPLLVLALAFSGCGEKKPAAGDFCKAEEEKTFVCGDAATALLCVNHRRVPFPCRGPKGCSGSACDATIAREGDACDPNSEPPSYENAPDRTCSEDKTRSLVCREGKFVVDRLCRGPKGCDPARAGTNFDACDRSAAALGDACETRRVGAVMEGAGLCSVDRKSAVVCDKDEKGTFVLGSSCEGPKGCEIGHVSGSPDMPAAVCDQSVATLGSACGKLDTNRVSCTPDGSLVVTCDPSTLKWTKHKDCGPKAKCVYEKGKVVIDGLECRPVGAH